MFPFSHSVTPAVRSHLDAQFSFFNDMSKSLSRSFQELCELNIQLSQSLLEESNIAGQHLLTTDNPTDALAVSAARAQPAADKLRAYQQHVSRVLADGQIALARVTEEHSQVTSRTARNLADKVAQVATQESEKSVVKQQEMMNSFRDPFQPHGAAHGNASASARGNMQSGAHGGSGSVDGERSGASYQGAEPLAPTSGKNSTKAG